MEKPVQKKTELVEDGQKRQSQIVVWLKRFGLAGFLLFLLKGLLWLLLPVLIAKGC